MPTARAGCSAVAFLQQAAKKTEIRSLKSIPLLTLSEKLFMCTNQAINDSPRLD